MPLDDHTGTHDLQQLFHQGTSLLPKIQSSTTKLNNISQRKNIKTKSTCGGARLRLNVPGPQTGNMRKTPQLISICPTSTMIKTNQGSYSPTENKSIGYIGLIRWPLKRWVKIGSCYTSLVGAQTPTLLRPFARHVENCHLFAHFLITKSTSRQQKSHLALLLNLLHDLHVNGCLRICRM